ncbi:DUF2330 domain-containing protein [Merismopedia glauca]|uniref:DUF2330 domain-containing protein n=1 Tax=Merismopedia glauca CCAP 1448/3 TaxID=1296344 RepID=A0A2T1C6T1_9CYAN|nr:DUF2330 domain-containing protein [Merismopedia glauca]PSB03982.1 DUF2330 domain-containing protein [Merismopedia glauca CCAP 1448/3]
MKYWRILSSFLLAITICFSNMGNAWAFCGFYVSKADSKLYNQASQVVIARDGDRTILTMANDYQGDVKDFAIVVPVPVKIEKEQVKIGDPKVIERLDAFSAPRLVEYFDSNPCEPQVFYDRLPASAPLPAPAPIAREREGALGVTIEAKFNVGEYEILVLSAKQSDGLETWLKQNGYKLPRGASQLLQPYIKQKMKFFVAKVNLKEFDKSGSEFLRPLMIAYSSPKFMLPIRLGMMNSTNEQDLIVYVLSPKGQAEVTNYRTVKVPSGDEIPVYVKNEFGEFYKSMFQTSYNKEDKKVAFLEYAWNMSNCDPCSAEPLNEEELKKAGVFWLKPDASSQVFISRIHVRYTRDKFPEDLMFQETSNQESFQGRYVLRHAYTGETNCSAGREYRRGLKQRFEREAQTLAKLTGWNIRDIRKKLDLAEEASPPSDPFWKNIWGE